LGSFLASFNPNVPILAPSAKRRSPGSKAQGPTGWIPRVRPTLNLNALRGGRAARKFVKPPVFEICGADFRDMKAIMAGSKEPIEEDLVASYAMEIIALDS
jgi:hypothetical protein